MATHSGTLAWKIPWMEEPGGLQPMGLLSRTRLSDFTFTFYFHALEKEMATHSSVLAWRIPGIGEPGGLPFTGSHRVRHDSSNLAAAVGGDYTLCLGFKIHLEVCKVVFYGFSKILFVFYPCILIKLASGLYILLAL